MMMNNHNVHRDSPSASSIPSSPLSFSKKLHSSLSNISCCFRRLRRRKPESGRRDPASTSRLLRCSSLFSRSRASPRAHSRRPDIMEKSRSILSRLSTRCRRHSADFRYDPLSYSMNFDEGGGGLDDDEAYESEFPFKSFSSRLPLSPRRDGNEDEDDMESAPSPASTPRASAEIVSAE